MSEDDRIEVLGYAVGDTVVVLKSGLAAKIGSIHLGLNGVWFHVVIKGRVNQKKLRLKDIV